MSYKFNIHDWQVTYIENKEQLKEAFNHWKIKRTHTLIDTETTGLRVGVNQDYAFLKGFGYLSDDLTKEKNQAFVVKISKLSMSVLWEICKPKNSQYVWAWNTKFDINMLRNSALKLNDNRWENHLYENFVDGMALYRLTENVDKFSYSIKLKNVAQKEIFSEAKETQDIIKKLLDKEMNEFKNKLFTFLKKKGSGIKRSEISNLMEYDYDYNILFMWYREFLWDNKIPNYYTVYNKYPKEMKKYQAMDIISMGEVIRKKWPILLEREQVEVFEQECKIICQLANQERTGISVDWVYLKESYYKVSSYLEFLKGKLNELLKISNKHSLMNLTNKEHLKLAKESFTKPILKKGVKVTPNDEYIFRKIKNFALIWKDSSKINLKSIDQLKMYVFMMVGKTGYSWDTNHLEELQKELKGTTKNNEKVMFRVIKLLFTIRRVEKWLSTYIKKPLRELNQSGDNRIHYDFKAYATDTGRFSSSIQQMPSKPLTDIRNNEELFHPRKMIIVNKHQNTQNHDWTPSHLGVLVVDLSQIELRVLAHYTKMLANPDSLLVDSIIDGVDMHTYMAADTFHHQEFNKDKEHAMSLVTKDERTSAKSANFALNYGGGISSLKNHPQVGKLPAEEIHALLNNFDKNRKGTRIYQKWIMNLIQKQSFDSETNFITNMYGRRYFVSKNWAQNNAYKTGNWAIQGTCAYALKNSLYGLNKYLVENNLKSKIIVHIHDEIQVEIAVGEEFVAQKVIDFITDMPWCTIPVVADAEFYDTTWAEKYAVEIINDKIIRKELKNG